MQSHCVVFFFTSLFVECFFLGGVELFSVHILQFGTGEAGSPRLGSPFLCTSSLEVFPRVWTGGETLPQFGLRDAKRIDTAPPPGSSWRLFRVNGRSPRLCLCTKFGYESLDSEHLSRSDFIWFFFFFFQRTASSKGKWHLAFHTHEPFTHVSSCCGNETRLARVRDRDPPPKTITRMTEMLSDTIETLSLHSETNTLPKCAHTHEAILFYFIFLQLQHHWYAIPHSTEFFFFFYSTAFIYTLLKCSLTRNT